MSYQVRQPFAQFFDLKGKPLEGGFIYFGEVNKNPQTDPITVYSDDALTQPLAQPLRTVGGYVALNGKPIQVFTADTAMSVACYGSDRDLAFYLPEAAGGESLLQFIADLANDGDPAKGAALIGYSGRTVADRLKDVVCVEDFGAIGNGVVDDRAAIQAAIDYAIPLGKNVVGNNVYSISGKIEITQYRTDPAVSLDFSTITVFLNEVILTATTGSAIECYSPTTTVHVKKLFGPGGSTSTSGLYISGQGDPGHKVGYVSGFGVDVNIESAYSHTVWVGYAQDADVGVLLTDSNANKIYSGRIGGRFTDGTVLTDPTTCSVGVKVVGGEANEIHANIEYCKRDSNAVGLLDGGSGTRFYGYIEGCAKYNLHSTGTGSEYQIITGGNVGPSGVRVDGDSSVKLLKQQTSVQETPTGSNTTLTFLTPSKFESSGFGSISGHEGYQETQFTALSDIRNEIASSCSLAAPNWSYTSLGAASWGSVAVTVSDVVNSETGYTRETKFVFPATPGADSIYRVTQTGRIARVGPIVYGAALIVESGDVDVMVRVLEGANNVQSKQVVRLGASNKVVDVGARYTKTTPYANDVLFELQFRTSVGAVVRVLNTYLVTDAQCIMPSPNYGSTLSTRLKGKPIDGNMVERGISINGGLQLGISPAISSAGQYVLDRGLFPVYLVTGGWSGNLFLENSPVDGLTITIKRDDVAASGVMQILPTGSIEGSSAGVDIAPAWTAVNLVWSAALATWLRV